MLRFVINNETSGVLQWLLLKLMVVNTDSCPVSTVKFLLGIPGFVTQNGIHNNPFMCRSPLFNWPHNISRFPLVTHVSRNGKYFVSSTVGNTENSSKGGAYIVRLLRAINFYSSLAVLRDTTFGSITQWGYISFIPCIVRFVVCKS
jgi:hypothetical protein